MEPSQFVMDTVMAVATHYAQRGVIVTVTKAKEIIGKVCDKNPSLRSQIDVDKMAEKIQATAGHVGRIAYNEETLARFLEIPISDLSSVRTEDIDTHTLYDHVRLESEFQQWMLDWGYDVDLGCALQGLKGIEFTPDVYGKLETLHGGFEFCVNFVCDSPPSEDRVFALLGKIEAYAEGKKSFSLGDIFLVTTPHRFTPGSINAIGLQNEQEDYLVLPLDGGDIFTLENARSPKERLDELLDRVKQAEIESKRGKKKYGRERSGDMMA